MSTLHAPWLELSILAPLIGVVVAQLVRDSADTARRVCIVSSGAALFFATAAWVDFAWEGVAEAHDRFDLVAYLCGGVEIELDALTAPLLPLVALVHLLTAVMTLRTKVRRFSFSMALLSEALTLATLSCADPRGVVVLLGLTALPPWFELRARSQATGVYAWHMGVSTALIALGWTLISLERAGSTYAGWITVPLLLGILIRAGIAPFHCWVSDLFERATFGTALLFVLPMLGAYAALRLLTPVAPEWILRSMGLFSLLSAVYFAGMTLVQREARRFFCYLFLSNSALVLAGLDTLEPIGLTGALAVWLSSVLALSGLGLTLRALEARHGRMSLVAYHGLYEHTPLLAVCFALTGMATVGFPGTLGFLGAELLVDGAVSTYLLPGIAVVLAGMLNSIAVFKAYFVLFTGARHVASVPLGIGWRERVAVLVLAVLILGGGLWPQPGVSSRYRAAEHLLERRRATLAESIPSHAAHAITLAESAPPSKKKDPRP